MSIPKSILDKIDEMAGEWQGDSGVTWERIEERLCQFFYEITGQAPPQLPEGGWIQAGMEVNVRLRYHTGKVRKGKILSLSPSGKRYIVRCGRDEYLLESSQFEVIQ